MGRRARLEQPSAVCWHSAGIFAGILMAFCWHFPAFSWHFPAISLALSQAFSHARSRFSLTPGARNRTLARERAGPKPPGPHFARAVPARLGQGCASAAEAARPPWPSRPGVDSETPGGSGSGAGRVSVSPPYGRLKSQDPKRRLATGPGPNSRPTAARQCPPLPHVGPPGAGNPPPAASLPAPAAGECGLHRTGSLRTGSP